MDDGLGRVAVGQRPHRGEQRVPVGAGQVDAADTACEEQVAAEQIPVGEVRDVRRRVAGDRDDLEVDAATLTVSPPSSVWSGVCGRPSNCGGA